MSGGGKSVRYADLAAGKPFNSTISTAQGTLTSPGSYKVIGTRVPRIDIPSIVTGQLTYARTFACPGCSTAGVSRPRRAGGSVSKGATVLSIDKSSIEHIPNVTVVQKGRLCWCRRAE